MCNSEFLDKNASKIEIVKKVVIFHVKSLKIIAEGNSFAAYPLFKIDFLKSTIAHLKAETP